MKIILNNHDLSKTLGPFNDIGFVPTMGGIHEGHISLIKKSIKQSKKTLVSIFVNPKQFNNVNDFKTYPRNLNSDLKILKKLNVTLCAIRFTQFVAIISHESDKKLSLSALPH